MAREDAIDSLARPALTENWGGCRFRLPESEFLAFGSSVWMTSKAANLFNTRVEHSRS